MKKIITLSALLAFVGILITHPAFAGRIGKRQANQYKRICQGVASGELSHGETNILLRQQHRIQRHKRIAWGDGKLTDKDRFRLERQQDGAGKNIYLFKHNNR